MRVPQPGRYHRVAAPAAAPWSWGGRAPSSGAFRRRCRGSGAEAAGPSGGWRLGPSPGVPGVPAAPELCAAAARSGPGPAALPPGFELWLPMRGRERPRDVPPIRERGPAGGAQPEGRADKKEKACELSSSTIAEEPEPVPRVVQGDDIQALAITVEDLETVHAPHPPYTPHPPQGAGRILVRKKYLVGKYQPKERKTAPLTACPALPGAPREPPTFPGLGLPGDGSEKVLPHHILGSPQEFRMEALARGMTQLAYIIEVPDQDVSPAALKEEYGGEKKKKVHQTSLHEDKALQNWHHNMAIRKKQEKYLGEILQRPEDELLMSISENYRQIQEERDLIDRSLPALFPGKGYRRGSEFWSQPERIGDELTGLTMTLTQRERGYPEPVTHVGKPHTVQRETGLKPPKKIPYPVTWDKSPFLKHRRQELKPLLEELGFYKPDLDGLEVIGKGQPLASVSTEPLPPCTTSEESEILSDSPRDDPDVVPERSRGPSLHFGGQPARWIDRVTSCRDEIGIATRVTFDTLAGEIAKNSLMVINDGTTAIWYSWMRLPQKIPSRESKGKRMQRFYFDSRPGIILPGETRKFSFLFKSESAGIFSESWEFRTHPLLLGGALLQVTLWGISAYQDKLADLREKLERDLAAQEGAAIVAGCVKELLARIRTPERAPSPMGACATEEELFQWKNPELHYQHQVIKQLHELWRQHMTVPSAFEEKVSLGQKSTAEEDRQCQESTLEALPAQSSTTEGQKNTLMEAPGQVMNVGEEDPGSSGWNLSIEDFKEAMKSIPEEEQREAALAQLNQAVLELCVEERPTQSDVLYPICLQLWRETLDGLVSHSVKLRSLLGLPEKDTCEDVVPEETVEVKHPLKGRKEDQRTIRKEERSFVGKDKEGKTRAMKTTGKEKEKCPSSRKLKVRDEQKLQSSTSLQEVKGGARPMEAVPTVGVEPPQEQVDPVVFQMYQEKLYIKVYELLGSMVSRMSSLCEELKEKESWK